VTAESTLASGTHVDLMNREFATWDELLRRCCLKAAESPDPSTQNGAVLVEGLGDGGFPMPATYACNRFPKGVDVTSERLERPLKYQYVIHAEQHALALAGFHGIATAGLTLVCPWAACDRCAVSIIAGGISRVVTFPGADDEASARWSASCAVADIMLAEAGVAMLFVSLPLAMPAVRRDGELWRP